MENYDNLMEELYTSIHLNDLNNVKKISHYLFNSENWFPNYEMLSIAFLHKHIDIVNFFLTLNCQINGNNEKNYRGNSSLHSAILYGDSSLVKCLLDKGASLTIRNKDGFLPQHLVVYRNSIISKTSQTSYEFNMETRKIINLLLQYNICIDDVVNSYAKYGYTSLHLAAECANINIIPILLQANANFHATTEIGQTPLHIAAINGNCEIVDYLLKKGVLAFIKDRRGKTPLCWAIIMEHNVIIKMLVNHKVNLKKQKKYIATLKDDYSSILTAVKMNNSELVNYLLSKGANVNVSWKNGSTPLHIAVENSSEDIIKILLNYGADANAIDNNRKTPLYIAVERELFDIVKFLLNSIPSITMTIYFPSIDGITPLHLAVKKGNEEITKLLLNCGKIFFNPQCEESPLHIAVKENQKNILKILLNSFSDMRNSFGKTALEMAIENGIVDIVEEFCDFYLKENNWNEISYQALCVASLNGRENIVKFLLNKGVDFDKKFDNYQIPLIAAADKGYINIVQLLIDKVDVNEISNNGKTALHYAVENQYLNIVEFLIVNGGNINQKALGLTPLHCAVYVGNLEIVKLLLKNGADVNAKNLSDATPLIIAVQKNYSEILQCLIDNGADVYVQDYDSSIKSFNFISDCIYNFNSIKSVRPLLVAVDNGNQEIVTILLESGCYPDVVGEKVSPLHLASANGNLPIVKLLIEFGADLEWICDEKYTPLTHAIARGQTKTFLHLFSTGKNFQDNENNSQLHISLNCPNKDKQVVGVLLDFGANVNARNREYKIPLHCAISSENGNEEVELFQLLLDYGSDTNATDFNGNNALHLAVEKCDFPATKVFLDYKININSLNYDGYTPLNNLLKFIKDELNLYTYKLDSQISPAIRIGKLFVTLIAFKESINETVNNENLTIVKSEKLNSFYQKCKLELIEMKMQKIDKLSYYDILTEKYSKLFIYLRNEKIVKILKFENLKKLFPCYVNMIINHVEKIKENHCLLETSEEYFQKLFKYKLPSLVTYEIFKYLNTSDMKNIYRALYHRRQLIMKQFQKN